MMSGPGSRQRSLSPMPTREGDPYTQTQGSWMQQPMSGFRPVSPMSVSGGMMMQDGSHMMQQPMSGGAQRVMQNVMQFQTQEQEIVERVPVQWQERRRRVPVQVPVMVQKEVMVQQVVQPVYIPYREEVYYPPPPPPE
jgi:hypothetical protein